MKVTLDSRLSSSGTKAIMRELRKQGEMEDRDKHWAPTGEMLTKEETPRKRYNVKIHFIFS